MAPLQCPATAITNFMRPVPFPHCSTRAVSSTIYRGREMASYTSSKLHKYSRYFSSLLAPYLVLPQMLPVRPHWTVPAVIPITPWPCHVVSDNPAPLHVVVFFCSPYGSVQKCWVSHSSLSVLFISTQLETSPNAAFVACHITIVPASCSLNYSKFR